MNPMKTTSDKWQVAGDVTMAATGRISRHPSRVTRPVFGFTLIELLVVISIMGVLAALTIPALNAVKKAQYKKVARGELEKIQTALESFKAKYGTYPPANPGNPLVNSLYYELTGTKTSDNGANYQPLDGAASFPSADLQVFGVNGLINCSKGGVEDGSQAENFLLALKPNSIGVYTNTSYPNNPLNILITSVNGPDRNYKPLGGEDLNPFRYQYPGTHNPNSFDLWVQIVVSGKTNLICNWSREVQINSPLP